MPFIAHFHHKYKFARLWSCQFAVDPKLIKHPDKYKYIVPSHKAMIYRIISPIFPVYVLFIVDSCISLVALNI